MVIGIDCSRAFVLNKTGTENYSFELITQMLALPVAKHHHFVLFVRPNSIMPENFYYKNVTFIIISMHYLWTQVGLAMKTWGWFQKLDVLWVPAHTLPVLRNPKLKTVVTIHGLEYEWLPEYKNWLQRWYLPLSTQYAVASATKLIAVSEFTKKQLISRLKASSKDIKVIYEGSSLQSSELKNKYGIEKKKYILFVGTLQPRKNLPFLIEVFSKLEIPDLKLVTAGSPGWMTKEIYEAPAKYNVADRVIFAGRVASSNLQSLYAGAELYAQPSITEGFGIPILEAFASGTAVISSSGGALPEVVGDAGVVIPNFEVSDWVTGIHKIIDNKLFRERLIAAGKQRLKKFSWKKAAEKTLEYLVN